MPTDPMTTPTNPVRSTPSAERFFLDTEFIESGPTRPIDLLSIGIVAEDGREFYAVNSDAVLANANEWVQKNVIPYLGSPRLPLSEIRKGILAFVGESKPEFWGYYADYDWVVFCQIFGAMIDLPKGWPMFCRDLKQRCVEAGNPALPEQTSTEHNALNDARWNAYIFDWLTAYRTTAIEVSPISICPRCEGTGLYSRLPTVKDCAICEGTGRIGPDGTAFKSSRATAGYAGSLPKITV